jgi:hypothetical protein
VQNLTEKKMEVGPISIVLERAKGRLSSPNNISL